MSELMGDHEIMIQCVTVEMTCIIPFCKAIKHDFMLYIQRLSVFKFYTHIREPKSAQALQNVSQVNVN